MKHRNILPAVFLGLGAAFYASPYLPVLSAHSWILVGVAASYIAAGLWTIITWYRDENRRLSVVAVPLITFAILTGMWLYYEFPGPYAVTVSSVFGNTAASFLYPIGVSIRLGKQRYVFGSVAAFFVCIFAALYPDLPTGLNWLSTWGFFGFAAAVATNAGFGAPLVALGYMHAPNPPTEGLRKDTNAEP